MIDFGVAKAVNKLARTATGVIRGKYAYMSPEQAYGQALDQRSDIFALGIVFWESVCMERLFKRNTDTATMQAVVDSPIPAPSSVNGSTPKPLDTVILEALERKKEKRYPTAARFAEAIEQFLTKHRLRTTSAHVAAFVQQLFPSEEDALSYTSPEVTVSTSTDEQALKPVAAASPADTFAILSAAELAARIASTGPSDTVRGLLINALLVTVSQKLTVAAVPKVKRAAKEPKEWVDSLGYATPEFLRILWKAVELLTPQLQSPDLAFEQIGMAMMQALIASPGGKHLRVLNQAHPSDVVKATLTTIGPMLQPGNRLVTDSSEAHLLVVFKEDVLPVQLYQGFFRALFDSLLGLSIETQFEKPSSERVELTIRF